MDLLEAADFGSDIIVLQTVLDEVRHRSLPLYNRLNALIADDTRSVYVFSNEARWCVPSLAVNFLLDLFLAGIHSLRDKRTKRPMTETTEVCCRLLLKLAYLTSCLMM